MPAVFRGISRVAAVLVAFPFWVFAATLTPTHVHEGDRPHADPIVHSHFDAHHVAAHGDEPEVEAAGEHIVWLDASVLHATLFHVQQPALVRSHVVVVSPIGDRWWAISVHEGAPAHGPPRFAIALRAPPCLPV